VRGSNVVSLESGKKYGFTASIINVIMPVVAVVLVLGMISYLLTARPTGWSPFLTGVFAGTSVVILAAGIIGLILFFLAMYHLAQYYNEPTIFRYPIYGFIVTIIGAVIAGIIEFGYIAIIVTQIPQTPTASNVAPIMAQFMILFLAVFAVAFVCGIINAILYWRGFNRLGEKSGEDAFKTAGLLYLIGTLLMIIAVGVIIVWIAWIYAAKGYRQLQPKPAPITSTYPPAPPSSGKIYCGYCGTENSQNDIYCKHCGKPLHKNKASV
jgi:uncharacterized membrane protein